PSDAGRNTAAACRLRGGASRRASVHQAQAGSGGPRRAGQTGSEFRIPGRREMSSGNENPFARWSRRKRAALSDEAHAAPETKEAGDEAAAHGDVDASPQQPEPAQPEAAEAQAADPAEPLPRLEDLTAESDLTAFLKKGVPLALKSAALRKMWSLDPGIRDYVGPSEYAWDFNQPGSMAGFGPLDAKETVVDFLSKTVRALEPDAEPTVADEPSGAGSEQPATVPPNTVTEAERPEPAQVPEPL